MFRDVYQPQLTEKPDVDYHDITEQMTPINYMLDDKPIKQSELAIWEIVGADTMKRECGITNL